MIPLISVYITNYNYGEYIKEAIDSVLSQSIKDFELIIIDDGSTDNSKSIIEEYAKMDNINIIYQQNKGLNVTNNIAARVAKGKYIMRLDADDYLHGEALETMSSKLESDSDLGLVFPDYYYVDGDGFILGKEERHDFQKDVKLMDQPAHGACTMIRLDFLKEIGGYNEAYNCQDGYELWVKFINKYTVSNVSKPLFYYRQHGSNLTKNENKILDTRARINEDFIKQRDIKTDSIAIIPIRGGSQDLAFKSLTKVNLLCSKIEEVLKAKSIQKIVITSPDLQIKDLLEDHLSNPRVSFHHRNKDEARYNQSLNPTVSEIINQEINNGESFEVITLLTLEYPFLSALKIEDTINTLLLFGSDSIIGVRSSNSVFYQHHGDGLHPILSRDKFTKLEREALFKQTGGISATTKKSFLKTKEMISGKVGHIMMDQLSSLGLFSELDFKIAESLLEKE